jgi:NADP-dependent 3-hydroxy acid dehydrogenase YdfG
VDHGGRLGHRPGGRHRARARRCSCHHFRAQPRDAFCKRKATKGGRQRRVDRARRGRQGGGVARAQAILKRHGHIDILVNSAGINNPKRNFRNVSLDTWDQIVAVNLSGMFYCCHAVLPGMRERKDGLVINISSWAGRYASTLTGPGYNATKHAVVALTESINMEEGANGIRATSILPGEVATPILEKRPVPPTPEVRARMLQAEDLGATILYIATLPPRACVNELIISPTWNRFYLGGFETPKN